MSTVPPAPAPQEILPEVKASEESQRFNRDNLRRVPLASMKPAPYNPRAITDEAYEALKSTVEEFGMVEAIVWNQRSGNIVGGHQRYRLLLEAKQTDTWTFVVDLDEPEEMALNLALNNPNAQGTFKQAAVADIIKLLKSKKSPEAFKRSGLSALEKQLPLFDGSKAAPPAASGSPGATAPGAAPAPSATGISASEPKPDVKIVQLFLTPAQYKELMDGIQVCSSALSCSNASETIFKLVQMATAKLRPSTSQEPSLGSSRNPNLQQPGSSPSGTTESPTTDSQTDPPTQKT
jgi:hypothetical protein